MNLKVKDGFKILFSVLLVSLSMNIFSQKIDMDSVKARDEFRWGVRAYHRGFFNNAYSAFSKSLSYNTDDFLVHEWYSRVCYRLGFEEEALRTMDFIINSGKGTALLNNFRDTIKYRRGPGMELMPPARYIISTKIEGRRKDYNLFIRPSSIRSSKRGDGRFYVVSFGSNEILIFDVNGSLVSKINTGIPGLDHPYDILDTEKGYLFISEYGGDRILKCTIDGRVLKRFGGKGRGEGQLLGPQSLASDGNDYLFVTDWGNSRVCKFDYDGNFLFSFGQKNDFFEGLKGPTGIQVYEENIFVADVIKKSIFVFDLNGNYLDTIGKGQLHGPEGLSIYSRNKLLVSDTDRIVSIDIENNSVDIIFNSDEKENSKRKIIRAEKDVNNNILAVDFDSSQISFLTDLSEMYSGLTVQIDRVVSANYPEVIVDVKVQNRAGAPISGLTADNFIITEKKYSIKEKNIIYTGSLDPEINVSCLLDNSIKMQSKKEDIKKAVTSIIRSMDGIGKIRVVNSGSNPVIKVENSNISLNNIIKTIDSEKFVENSKFDIGLKLSASKLVTGMAKRIVIYITDGSLSENAFNRYGLLEIAGYLKNNDIKFFCVYIDKNIELSEELKYLCKITGGKSYYLYRAEGLKQIRTDTLSSRNGLYSIKYFSAMDTDFGRAYLPVEVEVVLMKRSGRDDLGYFAPNE